tara:strand:+ start:283 stop:483 length:201 start_codon:yes stop_codon:yes gene_type:complete
MLCSARGELLSALLAYLLVLSLRDSASLRRRFPQGSKLMRSCFGGAKCAALAQAVFAHAEPLLCGF